jgi:antitoxin HicB
MEIDMYFVYPATLTPDENDGGYVVSFRDVPEALTQGDSVAEALDNASDALDEAFVGFMLDGDDLPVASEPLEGEHLVAVPTQSVLKYFLRTAIESTGMTRVALAAAMGVDEKEVRRILDPHHNTHMRRLERALTATGRQPVVNVIDTRRVVNG